MKKIFVIFIIFLLCISFISYRGKIEKKDTFRTIKFSTWGSQSEMNVLKKLINDFENNNPDIKIELIHIPQNYFQKLHLQFASNLQSDVIFINNRYAPMYVKAGLLENLNDYNVQKQNFYNEAIDCFTFDNQLYAVPRDISNLVIYYNKDIFKQAGIQTKKISNIYELRNLAKKLTNKEHFGINFEEDSLYWINYLASNGGGIISDDRKHFILTSDQSINALNLYKSMLIEDKSMPSKSQTGSMTTAQMFIKGKTVMYLGGRWMVPKFRETIKFNWDIMEFPCSEKNKIYIDASGWAIAKNSHNKDDAFKFIQFISSKKAIDNFKNTGLIIPALKISSIKDDKLPLNSSAFINTIKFSKPTPVNENYSVINDIINEKIEIFFNGNVKFEEAFDKRTVKKIESLLQ